MTIHLVFTDETWVCIPASTVYAFDTKRAGSKIMYCMLFARQMCLVAVSKPDAQLHVNELMCTSASAKYTES